MPTNIRKAAKLEVNNDGYATGKLVSVEVKELKDTETGEIESTQLEWCFGVLNSKGVLSKVFVWTGLNVNPEKTYLPKDGGEPQYNKLTQMLLSMQAISKEQLESKEEIDFDVESLVNQEFRFKLVNRKGSVIWQDIDLKTITLSM
ncbi:hypothetical protein [Scytonema sp. NUACC26]|uniref:hypothetical protein n=1 Tax=Scytonema sp. NUACC26 TaxID=3140176 RepID=UPI0034DC37A3